MGTERDVKRPKLNSALSHVLHDPVNVVFGGKWSGYLAGDAAAVTFRHHEAATLPGEAHEGSCNGE